jgi:hypothetical protein
MLMPSAFAVPTNVQAYRHIFLKTCAIKAQSYVCLGRGTGWSAQFIRESYGHALAISSHGVGVILADSAGAASSTMTIPLP